MRVRQKDTERGGGNSANVFENALCDKSLAELGYASAPQTFTSDRLWSYEVGAKDSLLEGHLSTQASVLLHRLEQHSNRRHVAFMRPNVHD